MTESPAAWLEAEAEVALRRLLNTGDPMTRLEAANVLLSAAADLRAEAATRAEAAGVPAVALADACGLTISQLKVELARWKLASPPE